MARRGLIVLLVAVPVLLALWPASAEAVLEWGTPAYCEEIESSYRDALIEYSGWTTEQIEAAVKEKAAPCWEAVHTAERVKAEENARFEAERRAEEQKEAEAKAKHERERREWEREARARERERIREARRHRREWQHKPTVTEPIARKFSRKVMRNSGLSIWSVECGGGRIDRTHWRCRVKIFYHCLRGRIRVTGIGIKDGLPWYRAQPGELRPCRI